MFCCFLGSFSQRVRWSEKAGLRTPVRNQSLQLLLFLLQKSWKDLVCNYLRTNLSRSFAETSPQQLLLKRSECLSHPYAGYVAVADSRRAQMGVPAAGRPGWAGTRAAAELRSPRTWERELGSPEGTSPADLGLNFPTLLVNDIRGLFSSLLCIANREVIELAEKRDKIRRIDCVHLRSKGSQKIQGENGLGYKWDLAWGYQVLWRVGVQKYLLQTSRENLELSESLWAILVWFKTGEQRIAHTFFPTAVFDEGNFPEI